MELPKVSRVVAVVGAILLLGLAGAVVALFGEAIAWSQVFRSRFETGTPPTTTAAPILSGAFDAIRGILAVRWG
jgi:hypothetical protein